MAISQTLSLGVEWGLALRDYFFGAHLPKVQKKIGPLLKDTYTVLSLSFILFPRNKNTLLIRVSRMSVLGGVTAVPSCELSLLNVSFALTSHLHLRHQ